MVEQPGPGGLSDDALCGGDPQPHRQKACHGLAANNVMEITGFAEGRPRTACRELNAAREPEATQGANRMAPRLGLQRMKGTQI